MKSFFQTSHKGFFLVFALILIAVISVSSLVMLTTTQTNKVSSESSVVTTTLSQIVSQNIQAIAKTLNSSTADGFMANIHRNNANIYFAWRDPATNNLVQTCNFIPGSNVGTNNCSTSSKNPADITGDLKDYIFLPDNKTVKLSNPASSSDNVNIITASDGYTFPLSAQNITQVKYSTNGGRATYTLKISQTVCKDKDIINSKQVCQEQNSEFVFTRDCPNSINGRMMRALTDAEIKLIGGGGYTAANSYPNLYCTCGDSQYPLASREGTCCGLRCILDSSGNQCAGIIGNRGWPDQQPGSLGTYLMNSDTCADCSVGCSSCSSATKCLYCYRINEHSGYVLLNPASSTSSCLPCGYNALVNGRPSTGFYNDNIRPIPQCSACDSKCLYCYGPRYDQCIACRAGNIRGGSNNSTCSPCPEGTFSFDEFRSTTCAVNTSTNCFTKSKTSNTCEVCYARSNNSKILLDQDGYYLVNGGCELCPVGSSIFERCQCPYGVGVSKDGVLMGIPKHGYRWLENRPRSDKNYWNDNCRG
jgi:hypothetical protein